MRKQDLQNELIEKAAKDLLSRSMIKDAEIDRLIANPMLYRSIQNRINAGQEPRRSFAWLRPAAASVFSLAIIGFVAFAWIRSDEAPLSVAREVSVPVSADYRKVSEPDGLTTTALQKTPTKADAASGPQLQNATYKRTAPQVTRKVKRAEKPKAELQFIPLVYNGDPHDSMRGAKVIRIEMPRESLFAMGINVPLENGPESVKADLIVGRDGLPRAVRIVD